MSRIKNKVLCIKCEMKIKLPEMISLSTKIPEVDPDLLNQ